MTDLRAHGTEKFQVSMPVNGSGPMLAKIVAIRGDTLAFIAWFR